MNTKQKAEAWVAELGDIQQYGLKISAEIITALLKENRALLEAAKSARRAIAYAAQSDKAMQPAYEELRIK